MSCRGGPTAKQSADQIIKERSGLSLNTSRCWVSHRKRSPATCRLD
ncbi:hypothetical protein D1AOALGA4SA_4987 [Olavius algarvensis Delta 1 endosymbiont]|nr:hypothetical protein D1AOALGA4SA_4987 [Olavius algarvensis Delta 1 endosymbiont]